MEEKLSTIERLWKANEERRSGSVIVMEASFEHERQRAARAPQQRAEATARELPEDLFDDDPDIQRLRREHQTIAARVQGLARASRIELQATIQRIEQEVSEVQDQVRGAAVDDVLDGDFNFPRGAALVLRAEQLGRQLDAARRALEVIMKPPHERTHFDAEAHRAKEALTVALLERKRAYVAEHPELLDCDLDVVRQHERQPPVSPSGKDADARVASVPAGAVAWDRIELDYRAGVKSLREIAVGSGVSHVAISKHAQKAGWTRDLSQQTQAEADELVNKPVASSDSGVNSLSPISERETIDAAEAGLDTDAELASPSATVAAEEGPSAVLSGEDAP